MLYSSEGINSQQQRLGNGFQLPSISTVTAGDSIPTMLSHNYQPTSYQTSAGVTPSVDARRMSDADLLLNLHSPYPTAAPRRSNNITGTVTSPNIDYVQNTLNDPFSQFQPATSLPYSGMMIESQDIDMSMLADDMMFLEYLPQEYMSAFGGNPS